MATDISGSQGRTLFNHRHSKTTRSNENEGEGKDRTFRCIQYCIMRALATRRVGVVHGEVATARELVDSMAPLCTTAGLLISRDSASASSILHPSHWTSPPDVLRAAHRYTESTNSYPIRTASTSAPEPISPTPSIPPAPPAPHLPHRYIYITCTGTSILLIQSIPYVTPALNEGRSNKGRL